MSNPIPRPHPISGAVPSHAGTWFKCPNAQCGLVDLREGALIVDDNKFTCPNCGHEVVEEAV